VTTISVSLAAKKDWCSGARPWSNDVTGAFSSEIQVRSNACSAAPLNTIDLYTRVDPAEYVDTRDFLNAAVLAGAGLLAGSAATDEPSPVWKLGWAKRGQMINEKFGDPTFPTNYPVIDKMPDGVVTSVKSIDLNAATYQNDISLGNRLLQYTEDVRDFDGARWGGLNIQAAQITGRAVQLIVPKGSMTDAQRVVLDCVRQIAKQNNRSVDIIVTGF